MKTQDFITQCVNRINNGETITKKYNSSVMVDGDTIYSYNYHYPLLFRVTRKDGRMVWVLNNGGYSATTGKHISWARSHADVYAPLGAHNSGWGARSFTLEDTRNALKSKAKAILEEMDKKKRKDTYTYTSLQRDLENTNKYIEHIEG